VTGFPSDPGRPAEWPGRPVPDSRKAGLRPEGSASEAEESEQEPSGIRIQDKRRIDPETYEPRPGATKPGSESVAAPASSQPMSESESVPGGQLDPVDERVAELTADLKRLSAEYANYRRRVDRDRALQAELTTVSVMSDLLPVLDDLSLARDHGELDGGFRAVSDAVEGLAEKSGVERFGVEGEPFDPNFHEAMTSDTGPDVTEPTVTKVYQVGYRIGDRVLRAARVGVTDAE
jgi:molecular chaperone GrpE